MGAASLRAGKLYFDFWLNNGDGHLAALHHLRRAVIPGERTMTNLSHLMSLPSLLGRWHATVHHDGGS